MTEHAVVIVGAGPTGLMLAGELALAGIDVAIIERRPDHDLAGRRAGGLHSRTIELLDQRGIADRFLSQGQPYKVVSFHVPLDISDFPTRHNYVLAQPQNVTERILAGWIGDLGVPIYREREVTGFNQDDAGVDVQLADGDVLHAHYLVGCDGGRSVIRKAASIEFSGWDPTTSWLMAEFDHTEELPWGFKEDALGIHASRKLEDGRAAVVLTEREVGSGREPTPNDVREALITVFGTEFGMHNPTLMSRFTDMTRQAASYRAKRVLLAGDAAHVHPPLGGQGLNIGVHDAVNLGWKLAQVVKQTSPDSLLDTYHAERHPLAARVLKNTMAHVAVRRVDDRSKALADYVAGFLRMDEPRKHMAAEMSGLHVHYDLGAGHPLLGRRMPDLDVVTSSGPERVFTFLHAARPVLLNLGRPGSLDITPWSDRVQLVDAEYAGEWELPTLGVVDSLTAVLIRPDGYVAWVGEQSAVGLTDALAKWFGAPAS